MTRVKESRIAVIRRAVPLACGLAIIVAYYGFVVGAGHATSWFSWSALYDAQAEGLRNGHLYLPEVPSKALQALPDPYNPANMRLWRWDHTYYKGHFYLYWGLVPGLLLAAFKTLFRIPHAVGDDVLTFWFFVGRLFAGTLLIRALARPQAAATTAPPRWAVGLAIAVFALAHPTPYTLNRGAVYEVAIAAGICFMVSALYLGWRGLLATEVRSADRWLAGASLCLGLAAGSRASLLPTMVLLVLWTTFARWRRDGATGARLRTLLPAAAAPAVVMTVGHFVLNHLRYDSWSSFGARYQLGNPLGAGLRFVIPNLYAYLFLPPSHGCGFPFLFTRWNTTRALTPSWLRFPTDYRADEPTIGLVTGALFVALLAAGVVMAVVRRRAIAAADASRDVEPRWAWRWLWGALALYLLGGAAPPLLVSGATMRYELDFASAATLMAILSGWWLLALPTSRAGRLAARAGYVALALLTLVTGLLLGFGGYFDHFGRHNPALKHRLEQSLNVCGK